MFKIGDKIRIIKCSVCFCPEIFLGKIDTIEKIKDGMIYLKKYNKVPISFVEKVDEESKDIIMEIKNNYYKPNWILNE